MEVFLYFLLENHKFSQLVFVVKPDVDFHRSTLYFTFCLLGASYKANLLSIKVFTSSSVINALVSTLQNLGKWQGIQLTVEV